MLSLQGPGAVEPSMTEIVSALPLGIFLYYLQNLMKSDRELI